MRRRRGRQQPTAVQRARSTPLWRSTPSRAPVCCLLPLVVVSVQGSTGVQRLHLRGARMRTALTSNRSKCWAACALCLPLFVSLLQALEHSSEPWAGQQPTSAGNGAATHQCYSALQIWKGMEKGGSCIAADFFTIQQGLRNRKEMASCRYPGAYYWCSLEGEKEGRSGQGIKEGLLKRGGKGGARARKGEKKSYPHGVTFKAIPPTRAS